MRLRPTLWRYRYVIAAALLALAGLNLIREFVPEDGVAVTVASRDLPAGHLITAGDLTVVTLPQAPGGLEAAPTGQHTAVAVPAGLPIVTSLLVGPGLTTHAPAGTVVSPIHLADPAIVPLLRVGDLVDVYLAAADRGGADLSSELVTRGARVLALPVPAAAGGLLSLEASADPATIIAAIDGADAAAFAGASGIAPFRVILSGAS